jgi:hypothetical protein
MFNNAVEQTREAYGRVSEDVQSYQGRVFRKWLETLSSLSAFIMGLAFILGSSKGRPPIFAIHDTLINSYLWGAIMVSLAMTRILVLVVNGHWPHSYFARKWLGGAFILFIWAPVGISFWLELLWPSNNGIVSYPGLAYSVFATGGEFLLFFAHATFLYAAKKG